jgi:hypothetical protein
MSRPNSQRELVARLGLKQSLRSWRGHCARYSYMSSVLPARDQHGWPMLCCTYGCTRDDRNNAMRRITSGACQPPARSSDDDGSTVRTQSRALALWNSSQPAAGTLADQYLIARGLSDLEVGAHANALLPREKCNAP